MKKIMGENHATFKLSASGEAVYLSDANFNLVERVLLMENNKLIWVMQEFQNGNMLNLS